MEQEEGSETHSLCWEEVEVERLAVKFSVSGLYRLSVRVAEQEKRDKVDSNDEGFKEQSSEFGI